MKIGRSVRVGISPDFTVACQQTGSRGQKKGNKIWPTNLPTFFKTTIKHRSREEAYVAWKKRAPGTSCNNVLHEPRWRFTVDHCRTKTQIRRFSWKRPGFERQTQLKATRRTSVFLRRISRDPSLPFANPLEFFGSPGLATFYAFTLRGKCQRTVLNKYKKVTDWQWATYVPARRREVTALTGASWYADGVRRGGIAEQRASGLGYETILEIRDRIASRG